MYGLKEEKIFTKGLRFLSDKDLYIVECFQDRKMCRTW